MRKRVRIRCGSIDYRQGFVEVSTDIHPHHVNLESWTVHPEQRLPDAEQMDAIADASFTGNTELELTPAEARQLAAGLLEAADAAEQIQMFELDGSRCVTLEAFYDEVSRVLIPGSPWGRNLDAFNDILRGSSYMTPRSRERGPMVRWSRSSFTRHTCTAWHRQDGVPTGTGWRGHARIQLTGAAPPLSNSLPADISTGTVHVGESEFANLVPIPLSETSSVVVDLQLTDGRTLHLTASAVSIELSGDPSFVEDLPSDLAPWPA